MARRRGTSGSPTLAEPGVIELKRSVKRAQALLDEAPIGICNVDLKGKITYANKRFEEVSGYAREEVVGKNGFKLGMFSRETLKLLAKRMRDRLMGRPPRLLEIQFKCKDGNLIWVAMEGKLMREKGIPVGFQITSRDITERKQAEEALRQSQEKLRQMFESVTDGISVIDLHGVITEVNQRTVEMHGFASRDELLGKSALELVAPRDREEVATNMRKALKRGAIRDAEYTLLKADGTEFPGELSTSVLKDASGNWIGHITIGRDISERKQAEEALQAEKNKLQSLIDAMEYALNIQDKDHNIIYMKEPTEIPSGGRVGDKCYQAFEGRNKPCDGCPVEKAFKDGKSHTLERKVVRPSGEVIFWENTANPISDAEGRIISCLEIARNITERKQAEEQLKEAQERLIRSEKLAAIGQLASGVGHELRNPLGAIKNAVLYVRRKVTRSGLSTTEPKALEFLDIIDGEVDSANKVITDLLSFSRVAKPAVSLVNVDSIIRDALNHVAMPENIRVTVDVDPAKFMVMVDAAQIRLVFINIILNAAEAMPEGGRLEIRAKRKADFVTVEFADTGCGISESVADKIFDPLFTTKPRGIGLGLAMCRSIIEGHGGDIGVKSKEGKGTTFILALPTQVV